MAIVYMNISEFSAWLNGLLEPQAFKDYCNNGLSVEASDKVTRVVTGVSFRDRLIDAAIEDGADCIFVHHPNGFWVNENRVLVGKFGERMRRLMQHGISLYGYHLPLDGQPEFGNNALIAKALGLKVVEGFMVEGEKPVGWIGEFDSPVTREAFVAIANRAFEHGVQNALNLTIEGEAKNIWIDHCEFWDGQDGNADVVKGADNVTFTWCIFGYKKKSTHNLSNLIGSSDNEPVSEGKLNVTYMFNWWQAANQRKPRCRYGNVHVVNNLLTGDASITNGTDVLGVSAGHMCTVRTERNVFINESNPIYTGNANGTGVNETIDNIFTNCSGNTKGTGTSFTPPYEYKEFMLAASEVEAAVKAGAGANLENPTECYSATEDTTVTDTVKQDTVIQDTTTRDTVVQDTASRDTAASDSIPQDSVVRDSTPEDTSSPCGARCAPPLWRWARR